MQIEVHGRNLPVTPPLREYVGKRFQRLDRLFTRECTCDVELSVERNPRIPESQIAEATLLTRGHVVRARSTAVDMYAAIDALADRVRRQVSDLSERASYGRPRHAAPPVEGAPVEDIVADLGLEEPGHAPAPREPPLGREPPRLQRQLQMLDRRVLLLRVAESVRRRGEHHHRRHARPRHLRRVVEGAGWQPAVGARHLADGGGGDLDQALVEGDRLDAPDPVDLDRAALLGGEAFGGGGELGLHRCQHVGLQVALVDQDLGAAGDGRDHARRADGVADGADAVVAQRDLP